MTEPMTDAELRNMQRRLDPNAFFQSTIVDAETVRRILVRLDAERSRADAAESARDAALARAMPEAQLIQTKEEAAQLPAGTYYISPVEAGEGWFAVEALDTVSGPRWLYLDDGDPRGDHMIAGCLVIRLPDPPIPTPTQEG